MGEVVQGISPETLNLDGVMLVLASGKVFSCCMLHAIGAGPPLC
jgi:hypothetical protein